MILFIERRRGLYNAGSDAPGTHLQYIEFYNESQLARPGSCGFAKFCDDFLMLS